MYCPDWGRMCPLDEKVPPPPLGEAPAISSKGAKNPQSSVEGRSGREKGPVEGEEEDPIILPSLPPLSGENKLAEEEGADKRRH